MYMIWTSQRSAYRGADGYRPTLTACAMKTTATPNGPTKKEDPSVSAKVATLAPYEDGFGDVSEGFGDWAEKQTKPPGARAGAQQSYLYAKVERKNCGKEGYRVLACGMAHEDHVKPPITDSSAVVLFNMPASADCELTDQDTM